jgi:Uma2 family endonuclease
MWNMGTVTTSMMTFEEFERLPEHEGIGKLELLEGELIQSPFPSFVHNLLVKTIFLLLLDALEKALARGEAAELADAYFEMGYKLNGDNYVQPDVSVTRTAQKHERLLYGSPVLAVEVISPSNTAEEMEKKVALYLRFGAREVWSVYRDPVHIVVHLPDDTSRTVLEGSLTTPLLPLFELRMADLQALIKR